MADKPKIPEYKSIRYFVSSLNTYLGNAIVILPIVVDVLGGETPKRVVAP